MPDGEDTYRDRFAEVVRALTQESGVMVGQPAAKKTFGHSALKINDKIFAMISSAGTFVVKLPYTRVNARQAIRAGKRFEASRGRPMKEWLEVDSSSDQEWLPLAREALSFVRKLP